MVAHQGLGAPDALMKQILVRSFSCALAETANEVRGTDLCFLCQIAQSKIALEVSVDEFDGSAQYGRSQSPGGVRHQGIGIGVMTHEITRESCGYALEKKQPTLESGLFFVDENFHQMPQSRILEHVVGLQLVPSTTRLLSGLLQNFIRHDDDAELCGASHLKLLRTIKLTDCDSARANIF